MITLRRVDDRIRPRLTSGLAWFCISLALFGMVLAIATPAQARVFVGFDFFAPPPYAYAPPPVYYAVPYPPAYYVEPAPATPASTDCRTFQGDATIDASGKPFYGTACLESDGKWHIMPQ